MFETVVPLFPGIPGGPELLVILLIAVLLFGANKIPKLARSSGEAIGEFQKGREEVEQELEEIRQKKAGNRTEEEQARLEAEDDVTEPETEVSDSSPIEGVEGTDETEETGVEAERES
jgi:sec-independent protein translocase protein TatA